MIDLRQDKHYATYMQLLGWRVTRLDGVYCYTKKLLPFASIAKIQRGEKRIRLSRLNGLVRQTNACAVFIEPKDKKDEKYYVDELDFKKTKSSSLPSKTQVIGLTKTAKTLLAQMHHKTRYNIKVAKKRGVVVKFSGDIAGFADFWQACARKRGMWLSLKKEIAAIYKAFGKQAVIVFAYHNAVPVGGLLLISTTDTTHYMYAASTHMGKRVFAPTLLVWHGITYAKKAGKKYFDFEGIYDERYPLKTWQGFSKFKKSFGGEAASYPGTVRRYFFPWRFGLE